METNNLHLGKKIQEIVKKQGISNAEFGRRINTTGQNITDLYKRESINKWVNTNSFATADISRWYIGVTSHPIKRQKQHQSKNKATTTYFVYFNARTKEIAKAIELYFHKKGMLETIKPGRLIKESKYVYLYKKQPTILD